ncbi:MAG: hypothetical protein NC039_00865 [Muribaculaceae bacterium]|nr:hypothetical protein [Muribaculaceae bacterium]
MKKLVLVAAVAFSASLFSCGSADKAADNAADSAVVVEETVVEEVAVVDSAAADSTVAAPADSAVVAE